MRMDLKFLELLIFISRILSIKNQKIADFLSILHIAIITKLKLKVISIKPISCEKFDELILNNKYKFSFFGDPRSCAIVSLNTLVALSATNKSWFKIFKSNPSVEQTKDNTQGGTSFCWKISMPPVEDKKKSCDSFLQCLCVSNVPKDFVLYVTDIKLFNIQTQLNCDYICDVVNQVNITKLSNFSVPSVAKTAVISSVITGDKSENLEEILNEYFVKPKLLKVGQIICVNLLENKKLVQKAKLFNVTNVYFKVITLKGQSDGDEYYVVKGYTDLYLNPSVHSYLPSKNICYIKTHKHISGYDIPNCPEGLLSYFNKIKKMFKFFIKLNNFQAMLLFTGAKGAGKKTVLKAVTESIGLNFMQVNCSDFFGSNPPLIQGRLDQICSQARTRAPCVVYFENIELLGKDQHDHENTRLVEMFSTFTKELWERKPSSYSVLVVGSTKSKPSELVPTIARLFIHTITFNPPTFDETYLNLKWLLKNLNIICCSNDVKKISEKLRGYVFADLSLLTQKVIHIRRQLICPDDEYCRCLDINHFNKGLEIMEAAYSDFIGAAKVPTVHWDDVGGLANLKEEILFSLNLPIQYPELFDFGLKRSGILFYGPPGTGKTLLAKAVATECNYNFLSVKGPELINKYVGQSEQNIREVFERAREASPCIIFFDELDSLAPSRGKSGDSGGVSDRVVSQLLAEMDGLEKNKNVLVIAATNRPDLIDQALLRPGRFDKMFYVGVCNDEESILSVLTALTKRFALGKDVAFGEIVRMLPKQVTGADLYSICASAWFSAARRAVCVIESGKKPSLPLEVTREDFRNAVLEFVPSLTLEDINYYENLRIRNDR